jgi:tetratricopeptide (TPR) repeat protein
MRLEQGELDAEVFRERVEAGRNAARAGQASQASDELSSALALWRGPALADISGQPAQAEAASLNEAYLTAQEESLEIALALDRHAQVIPDLRSLSLQHPRRERLAGLLMRALYRCGQQVEALQVYRKIRQALVEELAVEPSPELRHLHQQILNHEVEPTAPATQSIAGPSQIPADVPGLVGRERQVRTVVDFVDSYGLTAGSSVVSAVDGMAGVGKTAFAVHVCYVLADRYPDGQLFIDLRGHTPGQKQLEPAAALADLLQSLGVPGASIPGTLEQRAGMWRTQLAKRRIVVVLDNAVSTSQVEPLLPGSGRSLVLITSRYRLIGLRATQTLSLAPLSPTDAPMLLSRMLVDGRAEAEPGAARELVEMYGRLPAAICLAAERLRHRSSWSIADLNEHVRGDLLLVADVEAGNNALVPAFAESYRRLSGQQQQVFRLLRLHGNRPFSVRPVAAATGLSLSDAESVLESLVDANVLESFEFGRYRLQELLSAYLERCHGVDIDEIRMVVPDVLNYYLLTGENAYKALFPKKESVRSEHRTSGVAPQSFKTREEALRWWKAEREVVAQLVSVAPASPFDVTTDRRSPGDWSPGFTKHHLIGRMVAGPIEYDPVDRSSMVASEAQLLGSLAVLSELLDRYEDAIEFHRRAISLYRSRGNAVGEAAELCGTGLLYAKMGRFDESLSQYQQAIGIYEILDEPWGTGRCLVDQSVIYQELGQYSAALLSAKRAAEMFDDCGDHYAFINAQMRIDSLLAYSK